VGVDQTIHRNCRKEGISGDLFGHYQGVLLMFVPWTTHKVTGFACLCALVRPAIETVRS
jgi:hypothetical protein